MRTSNERGVAMITTLLVMMLMAALMVGFTAVVMSDQRFRGIDRDRMQSFYAAHSGLERMTVDLFSLFKVSVVPTADQLAAIQTTPPVIPGISYLAANGTSGYTLTAQAPSSGVITTPSSPYAGLIALKTIYDMDSTARTGVGGEVHLSRRLETVAIPVFQFGTFSDVDLSFSAADDFDFGGRVHTNGDLFLAQGSGSMLTLRDKVTAVGEVVRQKLSNGNSIDNSGSTGTVSMAKVTGATTSAGFRDLARTEGSVTLGPGPTPAPVINTNWSGLSQTTYNSMIRNGDTGARRLDLPLITTGGSNIDLVRRPKTTPPENATLLGQRFYSRVSLRILMSDLSTDLSTLPGIDTTKPPVSLDGKWNTTVPNNGTAYGPINATHPPIALSSGTVNATVNPAVLANAATVTVTVFPVPTPLGPTTLWYGTKIFSCGSNDPVTRRFTGCIDTPAIPVNQTISNSVLSSPGTGLIGGFIKIEMQSNANAWQDVTMEILNWGIAAPNVDGAACANTAATTLNAIIRLQRLRDNTAAACNYAGSTGAGDYWPNALFDAREALQRDDNPGTANVFLGGVMYYVSLDVGNLSKWFQGLAPYNGGSGVSANDDGGAGYSVYFSDRRNNRDTLSKETGEYGWEDSINPASPTGTPNGSLDLPGEDVNGNGTLEVYGGVPNYTVAAALLGYNVAPPGNALPLTNAARPTTLITPVIAKVNRPIIFRRALKLTNAATLVATGIQGLTIASENPVYVQGNWNATSATWTAAHAATSIIADAVTMLSANWDDNNSFGSPYNAGGRPRSGDSFFRVAVIAGKGPIFPLPSGAGATFGTDGGAHSFLRFLEGDSAGGNNKITYRGAMVTFFYNRQAVGSFKCCGDTAAGIVYSVPTRVYTFDTDFLNPALLPPLTPVFRDLNTLGFSEETRPGR